MESNGFFGLTPQFDGTIQRFSRNGKTQKNCWFVGYTICNENFKDPFYIAIYGDWSTGEKYEFKSKKNLTKDQKQDFEKYKKQAEDKRAAQQIEIHAKAKLAAQNYIKTLEKLTLPTEYLGKKKCQVVPNLYLEPMSDSLIVPMYHDLLGSDVVSYQEIYNDGTKLFQPGCPLKGALFPIWGDSSTVYLCEGIATAISVFMATQKTVIVFFNASNCKNVLKTVKDHFRDNNIIICSDNDKFKAHSGNTGYKQAVIASEMFNVPIKIPEFLNNSSLPTDFNDLHCLEGLEEVARQLAIEPELEKYPTMKFGFHYQKITDRGEVYIPDFQGLSNYFRDEIFFVNNEGWQSVYSNGYYKRITDLEFEKHIFDFILKVPTERKPTNAITYFKKYIKSNCIFDSAKYQDSKFKVNLKNGILDLKTKKLIEHSPKYFFKYKIPYDYDPSAQCPLWHKFLRDVFYKNGISQDLNEEQNYLELSNLVFEIFGYTLLGGEPFLHKAFCLIGSGRNGKSVFLNVLKEMISEQNYSAVSMERIDEPFYCVTLDGKLANIVSESPANKEIPSEAFKSLISGDQIMCSFKGKDNYMLKPEARLFFATNHEPVFKDSSRGLYERLVIIPFRNTFSGDQIDPFLTQKLTQEIPGIINWALEGLDRLMLRGSLLIPKIVSDSKEEYRRFSDSVYDFYRRFFVASSGEVSNPIIITDLYKDYASFCDETGSISKGQKAFTRQIKEYLQNDFGNNAYYNSMGYIKTKRITPTMDFLVFQKKSGNYSYRNSDTDFNL